MTDKKDRSKLSPSEIIQLANTKSQGKRPEYFSDSMSEHSFSISMALMAELAVARERIDTLERLLVSKGVLSKNEVEEFVPSPEEGQERQQAQVEYSARILRSLQQQVEAMAEKNQLSMEEMSAKLGETGSGKSDETSND